MGVLNSLLPCDWLRGYLGFEGKSAGRILVCVFWSSWSPDLARDLHPMYSFPFKVHLAATRRGVICILIGSLSFPLSPRTAFSRYCWEPEPDVTPCILVTHTSSVSLQGVPTQPQRASMSFSKASWSQNWKVGKILSSSGTCPCSSRTWNPQSFVN